MIIYPWTTHTVTWGPTSVCVCVCVCVRARQTNRPTDNTSELYISEGCTMNKFVTLQIKSIYSANSGRKLYVYT